MSLSDSLVFRPKPASIPRTTHRQSVPAYNGTTFSPQQTILINIPCGRRGHYLNTRMSYLKFKVVNNSATEGLTFDYSAAGLIQSLALYHGSNLLEQIGEYNALYHLLTDMQESLESMQYSGSILSGCSALSLRTGAAIAQGGANYVYVCVPVLSGIIGPLQSKYLPTGSMTGGDLRLELTLASLAGGALGTTTPNWSITDVSLQLEYVEVSSEVDRMIQASNPRYVISFESFANYTNTIASTETQVNKLIPARFSSLKTLYTMFRNSADLTATAKRSVSGRVNPGITNWYYQVSGENIPATPVKEDVESFAELQKAFHTFGSTDNPGMIISTEYYNTDSANKCSFAIGQNLETLSHKSSLTESGKNTLNTNCYLLGTVSGAKTLQMSTFAHYDGVLVIENGVASAAF